jgi:hypothetical protein
MIIHAATTTKQTITMRVSQVPRRRSGSSGGSDPSGEAALGYSERLQERRPDGTFQEDAAGPNHSGPGLDDQVADTANRLGEIWFPLNLSRVSHPPLWRFSRHRGCWCLVSVVRPDLEIESKERYGQNEPC